MIEEKEEVMYGATGGVAVKRKAHFLKPTVAAMGASSSFQQPFLSRRCSWPMAIDFHGWKDPQVKWGRWVERLQARHQDSWKKAGIFDAIQFSKCVFFRNDDLINGFAERWCSDSNTFVFPWGEATITLEDMLVLAGFSVLGSSAFSPVSGATMAEAERKLRKVPASLRGHQNWLDHFMKSGNSIEHEAFLCLWISRFVLPGNEADKIGDHVFPIAVNLSRGVRLALAPTVLANIYRDLGTLKVTMDVASLSQEDDDKNILYFSLWAPFQLVQLWVWERFLVFRPDPNVLKAGEVRAKRWDGLGREDIGNVRPIINTCGDVFIWRPYCLAIDEWSIPKFYTEEERWVLLSESAFESYARCLEESVLVGTDGNEPYQPHRVALQFGLDQDLPPMIPRPSDCAASAWEDYCKPFPTDFSLYLPARLFEGDWSFRYKKWWNGSVLVPVKSFPGVLKRRRTAKPLICRKKHESGQEKQRCAVCRRLALFKAVPPGLPCKVEHDPPVPGAPCPKILNQAFKDIAVAPPGFPPSSACPGILNQSYDGIPAVPPGFPRAEKDHQPVPASAFFQSLDYRAAGCPKILNQVKEEPEDDTNYSTVIHLRKRKCQVFNP